MAAGGSCLLLSHLSEMVPFQPMPIMSVNELNFDVKMTEIIMTSCFEKHMDNFGLHMGLVLLD